MTPEQTDKRVLGLAMLIVNQLGLSTEEPTEIKAAALRVAATVYEEELKMKAMAAAVALAMNGGGRR